MYASAPERRHRRGKRSYTRPGMPTYEYVCRSCGRMFEIVQSMSDPPLTICDGCGGELRKVFTAPAISFKGSGFYATDSRSKGKEPAAKTTDKKEAGGDSKPSSDSGSSKPSEKAPSSSSSSSDSKPPAPKKESTGS